MLICCSRNTLLFILKTAVLINIFVETVIISHIIILSSFVLINYSECLFKTTPYAVSATWFFTHSSRDQGSQFIHERMLPLRGREGARKRCRTVLIKTTPSLVGSNLKRRSKRDSVDEEYMHYIFSMTLPSFCVVDASAV